MFETDIQLKIEILENGETYLLEINELLYCAKERLIDNCISKNINAVFSKCVIFSSEWDIMAGSVWTTTKKSEFKVFVVYDFNLEMSLEKGIHYLTMDVEETEAMSVELDLNIIKRCFDKS